MQSPVVNRFVRWSTRLALGVCVALLVACASAPGASLQRLDNTPRIALISAFEPEVVELLPQVRNPRQQRIPGVDFTTGTLASGFAFASFIVVSFLDPPLARGPCRHNGRTPPSVA